ncbi:MAG: phosphatase PAP2 family protein [Brevinema sp.]
MDNPKPQKRLNSPNLSLKELLNPDRILLATLTKSRRQFLTRIAILFTKIGNGQLWLLFSIVMLFIHVPTGLSFQVASITQLYLQIFLKHLFKRSRPYLMYQDLDYLYAPPDPYSFPSGHTCAAFTMFFVSKALFPIIWPYLFLIALVIALSRIYLAVHYPTDIFGGIIVAYISSKFGIAFSTITTGFSYGTY